MVPMQTSIFTIVLQTERLIYGSAVKLAGQLGRLHLLQASARGELRQAGIGEAAASGAAGAAVFQTEQLQRRHAPCRMPGTGSAPRNSQTYVLHVRRLHVCSA